MKSDEERKFLSRIQSELSRGGRLKIEDEETSIFESIYLRWIDQDHERAVDFSTEDLDIMAFLDKRLAVNPYWTTPQTFWSVPWKPGESISTAVRLSRRLETQVSHEVKDTLRRVEREERKRLKRHLSRQARLRRENPSGLPGYSALHK